MPRTPAHNELTDEALMAAWQRGDAAAFEVLYGRHRVALYGFFVRQTGNRAAGDDLFQDTWMTLVRQRARWEPTATLRTFLYRIAHSRLVDHFRAQSRQAGHIGVALDAEGAPELVDECPWSQADRAALQAGDAQALQRCLAELPPPQREAFLLKEEAELSLAEMSAATGLDAEALKSRVRYAIRKLRACLQLALGLDPARTEASP